VFIDPGSDAPVEITESELIAKIVNSLPAMIAYWDKDLRCRFANDTYRDWFGRPGKAMIGLSMNDVLGDDLFRCNEKYVVGALNGYRQMFQRKLIDARGRCKTTLALYIPDISDDDCIVGFSVLVVDVTSLACLPEG
jgi:PAS domain-containing protein